MYPRFADRRLGGYAGGYPGRFLLTGGYPEALTRPSWARRQDDRLDPSCFRDKERNEVEIFMENRQGQVVEVEVKAASTAARSDFHGMWPRPAAIGYPKE